MKLPALFFCLTFVCAGESTPPLGVRLLSNLASPQPVGTPIGLTARLTAPSRAKHVFRYSVSTAGGPFRIIRDFSQDSGFFWRPELYEHEAVVRVTVRNNESKQTAQADLPFKTESRVRNSVPVATPTPNPLIALFSGPSCPDGQTFRVTFERNGDQHQNHTAAKPCQASHSSNTYVAGMRADSDYRMRMESGNGSNMTPGEWVSFHTGILDAAFPPISIATPRTSQSSSAEPVLLLGLIEPWRTAATDLDGNVVWYLPAPVFLTRMVSGGTFLVFADGPNSVNNSKRWQIIREIDLAGNSVRETNIGRIAEQLESRGIKSDCKEGASQCVPAFHHEAIRMPNGHTLTIVGLERMFPAGTQGSKEPVDILGDLVIELDEEFQLVGVWNAFDHMDINRASISAEKCKQGEGDDGCTPVFLAKEANGWLHSNSLNYIPGEGNFLVSIPEQNWVVKVDYRDGKGSGKILWRLGEGGDFQAKSSDPSPWFSYQHDAGFQPPGSNILSILDDGHARKPKNPAANNRSQLWKLDEASHTATLVTNADMGTYSVAVGSAQLLANGNLSAEAGLIDPGPAGYSRAVENSPDGKIVYAQQIDGGLVYRSFRIADLYTAPNK